MCYSSAGKTSTPKSAFNNSSQSTFYNPHSSDPVNAEFLHSSTSEEYVMYWKTLLMGDDRSVIRSMKSSTAPKQAKSLGRQFKNFDQI